MTVKWSLEIPDDRASELRALMEQCGISTQRDLLNNALALFAWAVNERSTGRIIASVDEENMKFKELTMPALQRVAVRQTSVDEARSRSRAFAA